MRLTLRTLLTYLDDTLPDGKEVKKLGERIAESDQARDIIQKIHKATRSRSLEVPSLGDADGMSDPNLVANYIDNALPAEKVEAFERHCLESQPHLAEAAACHQILSLMTTESAHIPPTAYQRMYGLVKGRASSRSHQPPEPPAVPGLDDDPAPVRTGGDPLLLGLPPLAAQGQWLRFVPVAGVLLVVALLGLAVKFAFPGTPEDDDPILLAKGTPAETDVPPVTVPKKQPPAPVTPKEAGPKKPKAADPGVPAAPKKKKAPDPVMPKKAETPKKVDRPQAKGPKPAVVVGRAGGDNAVLFTRDGGAGPWQLLPAGGEVRAGRPLVSLPGYVSDITPAGGNVSARLFGTMPYLLPDAFRALRVALWDSRAVLREPEAGVDLDIEARAGRLTLKNTKALDSATVRLRFGDQAWTVVLRSPRDEVAVDVASGYFPGDGYLPDKPAPELVSQVTVSVVKGKAALTAGAQTFRQMTEGQAAIWLSLNGRFDEPQDLSKLFDKKRDFAEEYLTGRPAGEPSEIARETRVALARLRPVLLDADDPAAALAERARTGRVTQFSRKTDKVTREGLTDRAVAVFALQALGAAEPLIDAMTDKDRPDVRQNALTALRAWYSRSAEHGPELLKVLTDKKRYTRQEAGEFLVLFNGFEPQDAFEPGLYSLLIQLMTHERLPVREMAFGHLARFGSQAFPEKKADPALRYNPADPKVERLRAVAAWRDLIPEGQIPEKFRKLKQNGPAAGRQ